MMEMWYTLISDLLFLFLCFYVPAIYLLQPRKGNRYTVFLLWVMLYYLWDIFIRYLIKIPSMFWHISLNAAMMFLLLRFLYKERGKKLIPVLFSLFFLGIVTDTISLFFFTIIIDEMSNKWLYNSISYPDLYAGRLMAFLAGESFIMIYALICICLIKRKNWRIFWGFMLIPVYQMFLTAGFFMLCSDFSERVALIGLAMGIFSFILDIIILHILEGIFEKLDREEELLELEKTRQKEYEYYAADSKYVEEMRLIRHDFSNQLQAVYSMMDDPENAEKVKELLREMEQGIKNAEDYVVDTTQIW